MVPSAVGRSTTPSKFRLTIVTRVPVNRGGRLPTWASRRSSLGAFDGAEAEVLGLVVAEAEPGGPAEAEGAGHAEGLGVGDGVGEGLECPPPNSLLSHSRKSPIH